MRPIDVNGVNKAAGEYYHLLYNNAFGVRACSLRLTNVYGPRQLIKHNRQGFIGWFIRLAIEDREIQVFGDGSQMRDFVFVDDAADAFLRAGACDACDGEVFNVGGAEPIAHRDLVEVLLDVAGTGRVTYVPWPPEKKAIDIGSFYSDSSKFTAATRLDAARDPARRLRADDRVLPREPVPLPGGRVIPFLDLKPGVDAADVRAAIERVVERGWFVLGPELDAFEKEFAAACRRAARRRRRHRHRRARARAARARRRSRRRSDHLAAVGRLLGARDHDGRRAARVRRHRSRSPDARSRARPRPR